jgi:uncharacterized protein YdhG (YjbR/CyaY superfamily)
VAKNEKRQDDRPQAEETTMAGTTQKAATKRTSTKKTATTTATPVSTSDGFSKEERAAMKQRAAELRAEGKKGAKKADGLQDVLDAIAKMAPGDRQLAERLHATVTATAPGLTPKTWYGMPAYANEDGKVVLFYQDSGKFKYRYSTLGFQEAANLDDGDLWPVAYALQKWSPAAEKKVVELVKAAVT